MFVDLMRFRGGMIVTSYFHEYLLLFSCTLYLAVIQSLVI